MKNLLYETLDAFRRRYFKENYQYLRGVAHQCLYDKGFTDAVVKVTFFKAFRSGFDLQSNPRLWLLAEVVENIHQCNKLTGGKEVEAND